MNNDKFVMFENRLTKVYKHISKVAKRQQISCYRIYDKDLPEFPLIIDNYDSHYYVAEYKANHKLSDEAYNDWLAKSCAIIAKVVNVNDEHIYLKERKRIVDRTTQYQRLEEQNKMITVTENGLKFLVNLTDYLDTGLFLDHRITRKMVMDECANKKVLNLFCYTGSFSVYAAAGGASEVCSIDLSNTYIDWAKQNMQLNKLYKEHQQQFIKADVLQYIDKLPSNYYDIIILDPPTFSNSKMMKMTFSIQEHHVSLINTLMTKLTNGGVIYFSNNYTQFVLDSANIKASSIKDITNSTIPFDFEKKLKRWCFKLWK